jgi:hypothetical protein
LIRELPAGAPSAAREPEIGSSEAHLPLVEGDEIRLSREPRELSVPARVSDDSDALAHPILTLASAVFAHWDGREALHAGSFAYDGGAWALIGDRGSGKSSLLAALGSAGADVLSDDLLVFDGEAVYAGPRCLDLRPDAAERLGLTARARSVRVPPRLRLELPQVPYAYPLRGVVFLGWDERVALTELPAPARLEALLAARTLGIVPPASPELVVSLAALPAYELTRPRDWSSADESLERLFGLASA